MIETAFPELQRATLAALLGTTETLSTATHELIVALIADPRHLDGVAESRLTAVSDAAYALDATIVATLREVSEAKADIAQIVAEWARRDVDSRLNSEQTRSSSPRTGSRS